MRTVIKHGLLSLSLSGLVGCIAEVGTADEELEAADEEREVYGKEEAFRTGWHGDGHGEITWGGLLFLRTDSLPPLASLIAGANEEVDGPLKCDDLWSIDWFTPDCGDTKLSSEFHFDNCRIGDAFSSLNKRYRALVSQLNPAAPDFFKAIKTFGSILHTTQDFFAHTDWVDALNTGLVHKNLFFHPNISPGSLVGNMVVLSKPLPDGFVVLRNPNTRVPIAMYDGTMRTGLISGTYPDNTDSSLCPPEASILHGDFNIRDRDKVGTYMAKDDPDSILHGLAVSVATSQTTEEFCRLIRLVSLRYGRPGSEGVLNAWVGDRAAYNASCPFDQGIVTSVLMTML